MDVVAAWNLHDRSPQKERSEHHDRPFEPLQCRRKLLVESRYVNQRTHTATVCISVDYDAFSVWIAAGATGLRDLSKGEFALETTPRLLDIFSHYQIATTWFIPGSTALQYPSSVKDVADAGHEIANHSLRHEDVGALPIEEARASLVRANDILERTTGQRPIGARIAGADLGDGSCLKVLEEEGFLYDSSLLGGYRPFWAPSPHTIDSDGVVRRGEPLNLVELPFVWILTDFSQFEFSGKTGHHALLLNARQVEEVWRDEIDDLVHRDPDGFIMLTLHPQVIGRGSRLAMLERIIKHAIEKRCRFATAAQLAREFRAQAGQP
jgi:peptidoglycan/xylan/chitin deacetylase (PgdA/CDA1 family)